MQLFGRQEDSYVSAMMWGGGGGGGLSNQGMYPAKIKGQPGNLNEVLPTSSLAWC